MSAYVVVELTVKDAEKTNRYLAAAGPILKQFGGEIICAGSWTVLTGEPVFTDGAIIRFTDRAIATSWYNSPEYRATFSDRSQGIECRFRLLG